MAKQRTPVPRAQRGETLAEVLVAMLIVALSTMLLVTMVMTSARINIAAREKDKAFYEAVSKVEAMDTTSGKFNMLIEQTDPTTTDPAVKATVTGYTSGGLTIYKK